MPSLLEALEEKYGFGNDIETQESLVSIFVPKLPPRLIIPELLVLNNCDIDRAGEPEDLKKKCNSVKELDLAQNKLQNWREVFTILSHMPRVEFVNLSLNRLLGPVEPPIEIKMNRLRSLVLNNTRLDWDSVDTLLNLLPSLEELHLSLNNYRNVLIDTLIDDDVMLTDDHEHEREESNDDDNDNDVCLCNNDNSILATTSHFENYKRSDSTSSQYKKTQAHEGVKKLHFTGNPVTEWIEICRLGRVFPKLESLVLADCPLRSLESPPIILSQTADKTPPIPEPSTSNEEREKQIFEKELKVKQDEKEKHEQMERDRMEQNDMNNSDPPHKYFNSLTILNLSSAKINTWDDIDRLARFPSLKNLRVQNWPLWDKCDATEHERRQLLIARLPQVSTLNGGGEIGVEEREDAERAFIRYYMDKSESERPERYNELLAKHGKLDPLVNIDLRPEKRVKVTFTFGETSEVRNVDVYRTVFDLKTRLERLVGIPPNKMRLYYIDQDLREHGPEEMRYPTKQLYSYNIRSGDEIIVERK